MDPAQVTDVPAPGVVRCTIAECGWRFGGPVEDRAAAIEEHRFEEHDWIAPAKYSVRVDADLRVIEGGRSEPPPLAVVDEEPDVDELDVEELTDAGQFETSGFSTASEVAKPEAQVDEPVFSRSSPRSTPTGPAPDRPVIDHEEPDRQESGRKVEDQAPAGGLQVAVDYVLPLDVAGEAIAILAKRGAGKTNTGRVIAEEFVAAGVQIVVLDPVGVWWGLRSSADGASDGISIAVLGGEHRDGPLLSSAGAAAAAHVIESGQSLILDISGFLKEEQRSFVADFALELYQQKLGSRQVLHVFLEEADEFAPQAARGGGSREEVSRMRGSIEQLIRRGRSRGIGMTVITQRSASLSKDVLTQADVLIAMRTTGPTDVKAIEQWVAMNADGDRGVVASLPGLKTGEGWIWNPEREILRRTQIRLAHTFDSSSTPKFGEERVEPERLTPIEPPDLDSGDLPPPVDYRQLDVDGLYGCKIAGCEGRSSRSRGVLAYLCDDVHAPAKSSAHAESVRSGQEGRRGRTWVAPDASACPASSTGDWRDCTCPHQPPPVPAGTELERLPEADVDELPFSLALSGDFAGDATRVRGEALRLRTQADSLEAIAAGLDQLAETVAGR